MKYADQTIGANRPPETDVSPITNRMAQDYAAAEQRTKQLLADARALPTTVRNDEALERVSLVIRQLRDHSANVEAYRVAEKEPYLRGGQAIDGFFNTMKERLAKAMKLLHLRADDYQQEKLERQRATQREAERQARAEQERLEEAARRARNEARKAELEQQATLAAAKAATAQAITASGISRPADVARTRFESGALATMAKAPSATIVSYDEIPLDQLRPYLKRDWIDQAVRAWARATSYQETMSGVLIEHGSKTVIR